VLGKACGSWYFMDIRLGRRQVPTHSAMRGIVRYNIGCAHPQTNAESRSIQSTWCPPLLHTKRLTSFRALTCAPHYSVVCRAQSARHGARRLSQHAACSIALRATSYKRSPSKSLASAPGSLETLLTPLALPRWRLTAPKPTAPQHQAQRQQEGSRATQRPCDGRWGAHWLRYSRSPWKRCGGDKAGHRRRGSRRLQYLESSVGLWAQWPRQCSRRASA
jgi:hypothetical protein